MTVRKKIEIEGVERPYDEGHWVLWGPDGQACGFMWPDARTAADPVKAARAFFGDNSTAIARLNQGYRVELMTWERAQKILDQAYGSHSGGDSG